MWPGLQGGIMLSCSWQVRTLLRKAICFIKPSFLLSQTAANNTDVMMSPTGQEGPLWRPGAHTGRKGYEARYLLLPLPARDSLWEAAAVRGHESPILALQHDCRTLRSRTQKPLFPTPTPTPAGSGLQGKGMRRPRICTGKLCCGS